MLSEKAEVLYTCTDYYAPEHERVISFDDPDLGIAWPLLSGVRTLLSDKDLGGVPLGRAEVFD